MKSETRSRGARRVSGMSAVAADRSEDSTEALLGKQAARILRQFRVSPALALTLAEIAYDHRRPA